MLANIYSFPLTYGTILWVDITILIFQSTQDHNE